MSPPIQAKTTKSKHLACTKVSFNSRFAGLRQRPEQDACRKRGNNIPRPVVTHIARQRHPNVNEHDMRGIDVEAMPAHHVCRPEIQKGRPPAYNGTNAQHEGKEIHETLYWLELLRDSSLINEQTFSDLSNELADIFKMTNASISTIKQRIQNAKHN